jgi:two-component system phosphate regulon sensor histidine kinase PhoR
MRRRRLLWQLYPSYLLITLLCLFAATWYASWYVKKFYLDATATHLETEARLVAKQVPGTVTAADRVRIDSLCKELGRTVSTRFTVVLPSGVVIGDSDGNIDEMDTHGSRAEIREAFHGRVGIATRPSPTLRKHMIYVAIPVMADKEVVGVVRAALPVTAIDRVLGAIRARIALAGAIIAIIAAAISLAISRRISRPLEELKAGAERFAEGDMGFRLSVPDSEEMASLAEAMNRTAELLGERIRTIARDRNEREAILSSMVESVFAVDMDERLISMNKAAAQLLEAIPAEAQGRSIQEVIRNTDVQRFVTEVLAASEPCETEIALHSNGERFLHAHGTKLRDDAGQDMGALVVMNDVTRLRHLENVRRDFVANVSHELKTPVALIKGFVETLQNGAIRDAQDAERFLGIIARQTDRLSAIIDDLLSLSTIEEDVERRQVVLEENELKSVIESAADLCETKAAAAKVQLLVSCADGLVARINPALLEQALVNLLDNAIKYSAQGSVVEVAAAQTEDEVSIMVRDEGCGIEKKHLERLFERFYRVDKGRSRDLGGTGLGLAIVKHIAQAHGGHVTVESTPGKGSTFTIHLPR